LFINTNAIYIAAQIPWIIYKNNIFIFNGFIILKCKYNESVYNRCNRVVMILQLMTKMLVKILSCFLQMKQISWGFLIVTQHFLLRWWDWSEKKMCLGHFNDDQTSQIHLKHVSNSSYTHLISKNINHHNTKLWNNNFIL